MLTEAAGPDQSTDHTPPEADGRRVFSSAAGRALGIENTLHLTDRCVMHCPVTPATCEASAARLHRGAVTILADQCLGQAAAGHSRVPLVTLDLRLDWLNRPLEEEPVICDAMPIQRKNHVIHAIADLYQGKDRHLVACATGQFLAGVAAGGVRRLGPPPEIQLPPSDWPSFDHFLCLEHRGEEHRLPSRPQHIGSPYLPALHGGVTAAALQQAMCAEADRAAFGDRSPKALLSASTQFLLAGRATEQVLIRTAWIRQGRNVAVLHAQAFQAQASAPFAIAQSMFVVPQAG